MYGYPMMTADKHYLGSIQPDWNLGLYSQLRWGDWNFSLLVDIRKGGQMWNGTRATLTGSGNHVDTEQRGEPVVFEGVGGHPDVNGNMVVSGQENTVIVKPGEAWYTGAGGGINACAEPFIESTDWVRLRDVELSYRFKPQWFTGSFFSGIEVFLSGRNLLLWTPYRGADPETGIYSAAGIGGIDYFNLPATRSYTLGLKVGL
jgi:hypothetical protein